MTNFRLEYDLEAGSVYIHVSDNPVFETATHSDSDINIDYDDLGRIVGVELLGSLTIKDVTA